MEIFDKPDRIKLAFGIPFFSMDFNELMLTVGEVAGAKKKTMLFAASFPWLMDYAKSPRLCPAEADLILPADSSLLALADKSGVKLKMPLEYFEFPEQIARICAHYGYSLLHVSETALKTDILIRDGYVPLSWDLFTHFKIDGEIDEFDKRTIVASANDLQPDIVLISAPPESIHKYVDRIFSALHNCVLFCIPQDVEKNRITDKLDNILTPLLLLNEEVKFREKLKKPVSVTLSPEVTHDESAIPPKMIVSGTLDTGLIPDLLRTGTRMLDRNFIPELDLSATDAVSLKGIEALYFLSRKFRDSGARLKVCAVSDAVRNTLHRAGAAKFIEGLPGILAE